MSKYKNPFTEGTLPYDIWKEGYLCGKIDGLNEFIESIPSKQEIQEEFANKLELMMAKFHNKIM